MTFPVSPDDRPDPADQHAVRARVPDHVARGVFSTGVIVMTAPTEFVLDFIQNLGRPHQIVARVIMPHPVMPQFVDALLKNIDLYRGRYGNLPQPNMSGVMITSSSGPLHGDPGANESRTPAANSSHEVNSGFVQDPGSPNPLAPNSPGQGHSAPLQGGPAQVGPAQGGPVQAGPGQGNPGSGYGNQPNNPQGAPGSPAQFADSAANKAGGGFLPADQVPPQNVRRASAQEIYDDLKLRDELLSGAYANAVMIGHGPHEFSFDFITNFYPHSAVSSRVFLAAGQIVRLADSLRGAWDQIRQRFNPPGDYPFPGSSTGPDGNPPPGR